MIKQPSSKILFLGVDNYSLKWYITEIVFKFIILYRVTNGHY
jgi:hypothetical protein